MNTEERLRYGLAMIIIPIVTLIIFGGLNYVHRASNEVESLQTEVKTKYNLIQKLEGKMETVVEQKEILKKTLSSTKVELDKIRLEKKKVEEEFRQFKENRSHMEGLETFRVSAYDLSWASCNKNPGDYWYGLTFTGYNLKGKTREQAMTIATDPKVIPLGSRVRLIFLKNEFKKYDGIYFSRDIGGGIKNKSIDLFIGDFNSTKESKEAMRFGIQHAKAEILK